MAWLSEARQESFARRDLTALSQRLTAAGLATATAEARFAAAVDQHAAAVRDILTFGESRVGLPELAAYAQGVLDAAAEAGWSPEDGTQADWASLRLLAVRALARDYDSTPAAPGRVDPAPFG